MTQPRAIVCIVGPTASGKTGLAIAKAQELGGEIVSIDSRQIYRGFTIGTSQPTADEQAAVPHHLVNVLDPDETITAGKYVRLVHAAMADIVGRGRQPLLCGGTGLYFRVLRLGLEEVGPVEPALRAKIEALIDAEGAEAAHRRLADIDPDYAATIHPHNRQRLVRALEIFELTGQSPGSRRNWQDRNGGAAVTIEGVGEVTFELTGIERPRKALYRRIDLRVEAMLEAGWQDEVRGLLEAGVSPQAHPMQGIGYRELAQVERGELTLEEAVPVIQQRTRNFAKRQLTWLRKEPVTWVGG